ncbi:MAG: hypothetical protein DRI57_12970 [Deltaproteobacteria bacterium]|nr:MAG: hypothetical protein DRI57_12970 [Deltaproteobacteria bacterium]
MCLHKDNISRSKKHPQITARPHDLRGKGRTVSKLFRSVEHQKWKSELSMEATIIMPLILQAKALRAWKNVV